ncbi:hypothetical protein FHG87_015714, partial [Trinorchestia longiramus]
HSIASFIQRFNKQLIDEEPVNLQIGEYELQIEEKITCEEVEKFYKEMENGKARSPDEIPYMRLGVGAATVERAVAELGGKSLGIVERPLLTPAICAKRFNPLAMKRTIRSFFTVIISDKKTCTVDLVRNIEVNFIAFKASVNREWMTINTDYVVTTCKTFRSCLEVIIDPDGG